MTKRLHVGDEIESLATELDPSATEPRVIVSGETWPEKYRGRSSYIDQDGVMHFTLKIDRPRDGDDDA